MKLSPQTGSRYSQMIAAGRGQKVTAQDVNIAYDLLDNGVACSVILKSIKLVIHGYNTKQAIDRYHMEAISFYAFNYLLDVKNVNFKTSLS